MLVKLADIQSLAPESTLHPNPSMNWEEWRRQIPKTEYGPDAAVPWETYRRRVPESQKRR
jgi:hypothetical protein